MLLLLAIEPRRVIFIDVIEPSIYYWPIAARLFIFDPSGHRMYISYVHTCAALGRHYLFVLSLVAITRGGPKFLDLIKTSQCYRGCNLIYCIIVPRSIIITQTAL